MTIDSTMSFPVPYSRDDVLFTVIVKRWNIVSPPYMAWVFVVHESLLEVVKYQSWLISGVTESFCLSNLWAAESRLNVLVSHLHELFNFMCIIFCPTCTDVNTGHSSEHLLPAIRMNLVMLWVHSSDTVGDSCCSICTYMFQLWISSWILSWCQFFTVIMHLHDHFSLICKSFSCDFWVAA